LCYQIKTTVLTKKINGMKKIHLNILINASANKVWQVLWNDFTYRKWTAPFHEGSYALSDWKEGSDIQFLSPDGGGMFSKIEQSKPNEFMSFRHLGEIKNFEKQPVDEKTKLWSGGLESYSLKEENGNTMLDVNLDTLEDFAGYLSEKFPKALEVVKELAEQPIELSIETIVAAPIEKIWEHWTAPKHITQWNNASDDWHTPKAENDVKVGGNFSFYMEAKDGSFGFDFGGTYTAVEPNKKIEYILGDGRKVKIDFIKQDNGYKIAEKFEAEEMNSLELQQGGWQAILNNFKNYAEAN
jgi:uncharacterized protein YndB with AHSA1/START domain